MSQIDLSEDSISPCMDCEDFNDLVRENITLHMRMERMETEMRWLRAEIARLHDVNYRLMHQFGHDLKGQSNGDSS